MNETDIIAEIRKHREAILASFGGSMVRHHAAIEARQNRDYGGRLVMLEPRKRVEQGAAPNGRLGTQVTIRESLGGPPSVS